MTVSRRLTRSLPSAEEDSPVGARGFCRSGLIGHPHSNTSSAHQIAGATERVDVLKQIASDPQRTRIGRIGQGGSILAGIPGTAMATLERGVRAASRRRPRLIAIPAPCWL